MQKVFAMNSLSFAHITNQCTKDEQVCNTNQKFNTNALWEDYKSFLAITVAKNCIPLEQFLDLFLLSFPRSMHKHGCSKICGIRWPRNQSLLNRCLWKLWFCNHVPFDRLESKVFSYFLYQFSKSLLPECLHNCPVFHHFKLLFQDYAQPSKLNHHCSQASLAYVTNSDIQVGSFNVWSHDIHVS